MTSRRIEMENKRIEASWILDGTEPGLVAISGPCSDQKSRRIINEGRSLSRLATEGLVTIHRMPPWKPRTPLADGSKPWEGLETTNPVSAQSRIEWAHRRGVQVAIEIGKPEHTKQYARHLTFAWLGARSLGDIRLEQAMASPEMLRVPLGVKNGLDGDAERALLRIRDISRQRRNRIDTPAPTALIYRGGTDFSTPDSWADQYKRLHDATEGRIIVDTAHGSEMAHDPAGDFRKTVDGQRAALEHVIKLSADGFAPRGIMIEATDFIQNDAIRRTDPPMPFNEAMNGVSALHGIVMDQS